ncbi:hypothetical protein BRADI_2g37804v3 [Brachypodium distachyon]|uniref:Uncharacterized protein n=1 Tax=Brachypodium distachyon TaxID=15368 RepID=A0A2K2DCF9_BRADI|nr:hypothetical protein BRADI_2g37804v3 [Brachypodium distachyon]
MNCCHQSRKIRHNKLAHVLSGCCHSFEDNGTLLRIGT